jgi:hypothetical protein
MYLVLGMLLIPTNIFIIKWHKSRKFPLWASGIILAIGGLGVGYISRIVLVELVNGGQGGAIMAAFMGLVVIANGLIQFFVGFVLLIIKLFTKSNK